MEFHKKADTVEEKVGAVEAAAAAAAKRCWYYLTSGMIITVRWS